MALKNFSLKTFASALHRQTCKMKPCIFSERFTLWNYSTWALNWNIPELQVLESDTTFYQLSVPSADAGPLLVQRQKDLLAVYDFFNPSTFPEPYAVNSLSQDKGYLTEGIIVKQAPRPVTLSPGTPISIALDPTSAKVCTSRCLLCCHMYRLHEYDLGRKTGKRGGALL